MLQVSLHRGTNIYTQSKLCRMSSYINHPDLASFKQLKSRPLFCLQGLSLLWVEALFPDRVDIRLLSNINLQSVQFSSIAQLFPTLLPHGLQNTRPPCPSPTPGVYPNSCPLRRSCHPTISSSVIPFSSCYQSFPVSESFPITQFFASGGQDIGVSASTSVFPMNTDFL